MCGVYRALLRLPGGLSARWRRLARPLPRVRNREYHQSDSDAELVAVESRHTVPAFNNFLVDDGRLQYYIFPVLLARMPL